MTPRDQASLQRLVTGAAVAIAVLLMLMLTVVPVANNDIWIQMKVGQLIVETGEIPDTVLFAFTTVRDNHFNAHEWLASVVYHECDRLLGLQHLRWVVGAFALAQFGVACTLARRQSGSLGAALILAMLAMACANFRYVLRPELFALLLLMLHLLVLDIHRSRRRWPILLWTLPLAVLWANCHGSFLLGPGIAALFAVGEGLSGALAAPGGAAARLAAGWRRGSPYALAAVGMAAASLANPEGWHLLAFPFQLQQSGLTRLLIKEWLPTFSPLFTIERAFWIFAVVGLAALVLVARLRRFLEPTDALLFLVFAVLALERNRHVVWFGFVALGVCARLLGARGIDRRRELAWRGAGLGLALALLCACAAFGNAWHATPFSAPSNNFGPALVAELDDPAMSGNVLNSYELGGELIYRDWPRLKPSIDSRVDSYGDDYLLFSTELLQDEAALDLFVEGNRVDYMLLLKRDFDLKLRSMPSIRAAWHVRLTDGRIFLLERNRPLAAQAASAGVPLASHMLR